jgi:hypothetical protein
MKKKLVFMIPIVLLLGFLAFKPPAIGSEKGKVIVTPEATVTPSTKPQLRDFDDEGTEPEHFEDHRRHDEGEHHGDNDGVHSREHHDDDHEDDDD